MGIEGLHPGVGVLPMGDMNRTQHLPRQKNRRMTDTDIRRIIMIGNGVPLVGGRWRAAWSPPRRHKHGR